MTLFDYSVLVIVGLSVLFGVIRGLVREVLSLAAWVMAFVAANFLAGEVAALLPKGWATAELRLLIGFMVVFLIVLVIMSVLAILASKLVKSAGLAWEDRAFGGAFGLARGLLVMIILVLLAGLTSLPRQPAWRNAWMSGPFETVAKRIQAWLPAEFSQRIKYD
ncbi:MAG TPA: CvpA family protein [Burkholderiales bacterium]|nr:CvpA family protein [Burkholderiales bacterium]